MHRVASVECSVPRWHSHHIRNRRYCHVLVLLERKDYLWRVRGSSGRMLGSSFLADDIEASQLDRGSPITTLLLLA